MPGSKLQIAFPDKALPEYSPGPQLMPFHIAYSGPAPITTFFRIRREEAKKAHDGPSSLSSITVGSEKSLANEPYLPTEQHQVVDRTRVGLGTRLVAAFRGRRVVGLEVPLPEGYTGVVLRSDALNNSPGSAQSLEKTNEKKISGKTRVRQPARRRTRRSKATAEVEKEDEADPRGLRQDGMELDDVDPSMTLAGEKNPGEVRTLNLTQTFTSLVVWNPDIAVDEGQDEYIRALREWTDVAAELHMVED